MSLEIQLNPEEKFSHGQGQWSIRRDHLEAAGLPEEKTSKNQAGKSDKPIWIADKSAPALLGAEFLWDCFSFHLSMVLWEGLPNFLREKGVNEGTAGMHEEQLHWRVDLSAKKCLGYRTA